MKTYNKLVRDKILLIIGGQGKVFSAHTADEKEFRKKLNEKLTYECYIIKGDYPYITSEIEDLVNKSIFAVDQENLIKFLNFEDYTII